MCIVWELAVNDAVGEVMAYAMGVAVYDGVYILIIYISATVLIGGYFGFIQCGI